MCLVVMLQWWQQGSMTLIIVVVMQQGGRSTSCSNDNLVAISMLPSDKIQGVCHGAASGHSASGHVIHMVPIPIATMQERGE